MCMTNAAWIRIFNTHRRCSLLLPPCTDLYLSLRTASCELFPPSHSSTVSQCIGWAVREMVAWKGPPDLVEKKRLSHPIEWSIKKSTREVIRSCKVATLGLYTLSWRGRVVQQGRDKEGYSSLRACYPTHPTGRHPSHRGSGAKVLTQIWAQSSCRPWRSFSLFLGAALSSLLTGKAATDLAPLCL